MIFCSAATPTDAGVAGNGGPAPGCSMTNIAPQAKAPTSGGGSTSTGYGPEKLNDGKGQATCSIDKFCWISAASTPGTKYIQYDWPTKVFIHSMLIDTSSAFRNGCTKASRNLAGGTIQWWDGSKWVSDGTVSGKIDDWYYMLTTTVYSSKLRIYEAHATSQGSGQKSNPGIMEWQVFSCL